MGAWRDYGTVLGDRRALRAFLPALLARLAFAMVTLALILAVQGNTGSFGAAGLVAGAFGLTNVLASPYRARLVDRFGQRATLLPLVALFAAGMVALAALTAGGPAPLPALIAVGALTGVFLPPLGAAMRAIWADLAATPELRTRAYSVDAVAEELLFTVGPLVAAVLAASAPSLALLVTAATAVVGTIGMTSSAASRSRGARTVRVSAHGRPLRTPGFVPVLVALVGAGFVLGAVEIAAPAFAERAGATELAGVLLGAFAAGSAVGGLLYGQRDWRSRLTRRLLVIGTAMAAACAGLALADGVVLFAVVAAAVGFFLAPALITGYLLADELTTPAVRTEASSWINTAVNSGAALASAIVGFVVDANTPGAGLGVGALVASCCLALASVGLLRRPGVE